MGNTNQNQIPKVPQYLFSFRSFCLAHSRLIAALIIMSGLFIALLSLLPAANMLQASTLSLSEDSAPDHTPLFTETYISNNWKDTNGNVNNDKLLYNLARESLVQRLLTIAKYTLGGIFMMFFAIYIVLLITSHGDDEEVGNFKDQVVYSLVGFLIIALAEPVAYAFFIAREGGNFITSEAALRESVQVASYSIRTAVQLIQYILGAVALLFIGSAAFRIITATGDEEEIKLARKTIVWAMIGLIFATLSTVIIDRVFVPIDSEQGQLVIEVAGNTLEERHANLLKASRFATRAEIVKYIKYFQTFVGASAVLMLFLAGAKMVMASGNDEVITKQRTMISWIFIGLAVIMFAEVFSNIFMPELQNVTDVIIAMPGAAEIQSFSVQMGGITNFIISFASAVAVLAFIVGALYFSTAAINEEQAEKGKKIMLAAALGLVLAVSAYALVSTVLSQKSVKSDLSLDLNFK